jgi:uncharacterized membrane protein YidH (DUF202 family)
MHKPWDPGLQNERTGLAWQRTMLAGLTCGLLVARLLASLSVVLAVVVGVAALVTTAALGWLAILRFRTANADLHAERPVGDGRAPALLGAVMLLTGVGALLYLIAAP